jgi:hypothetical protein
MPAEAGIQIGFSFKTHQMLDSGVRRNDQNGSRHLAQ